MATLRVPPRFFFRTTFLLLTTRILCQLFYPNILFQHHHSNFPILPWIPILVQPKEVLSAVFSFKNGSAGGFDGLTPQHLKEVLSDDTSDALLVNLTSLVNLMLSGKVNEGITDILYGENLIALKKKDGQLL